MVPLQSSVDICHDRWDTHHLCHRCLRWVACCSHHRLDVLANEDHDVRDAFDETVFDLSNILANESGAQLVDEVNELVLVLSLEVQDSVDNSGELLLEHLVEDHDWVELLVDLVF